jgi:hypothetical protein
LRQHLGEKGIGKLFALPIALHADKVKQAKEIMVDIALQEKKSSNALKKLLAIAGWQSSGPTEAPGQAGSREALCVYSSLIMEHIVSQ